MASIREVAELAGVSVGSVSRYLNGQQLKSANMVKIAEAIKALDYKENIIAKGLKNNRSFSVGLLMNSISSRFGAEVVSSIEEIMEQQGYSLLLSGFKNDATLIDKKIDYLLKHAVDGLIAFVADDEWQGMERLSELGIPVVAINSPQQLSGVDLVSSNDRESVATVMQHILAEGHKKIGIIAAAQTDYVARERLQGIYEVADSQADILIELGDYSRQSGYDCTEKLLAAGITALFVSNYNMSIGALACLNQHQIKVGHDFLFSHFDYEDHDALVLPAQVVIQQPTRKIGQVCAELLLKRMKDPSSKAGQAIQLNNQISGL